MTLYSKTSPVISSNDRIAGLFKEGTSWWRSVSAHSYRCRRLSLWWFRGIMCSILYKIHVIIRTVSHKYWNVVKRPWLQLWELCSTPQNLVPQLPTQSESEIEMVWQMICLDEHAGNKSGFFLFHFPNNFHVLINTPSTMLLLAMKTSWQLDMCLYQ